MSAVTLFALGGTISMRVSGGLAVPALDAAGIADLLGPDHGVAAIDVARVGGSEVDFSHLRALTEAMATAIAGGTEGVIVTTGTDSIEETAAWLTYTGPWPVPVVVTGSMLPGGEPGGDAPANLAAARAVATNPVTTEPVVAFAGKVWLGRRVRKVSGTGVEAFATPGLPPLGGVLNGVVRSFTPAPAPARPLGPVGDASARVPLVVAALGADGDVVKYLAVNADALVLAGNGAGNLPPALADAAVEVAASGTPVVVATRAADGRTSPMYGYRGGGGVLVESGLLLADRMSPHQVRVFLTLAVSRGLSGQALRTALLDHLESLS